MHSQYNIIIVHWELPEEPKLNVDSNANFPIYYEMHRPKDMSIIHCTD